MGRRTNHLRTARLFERPASSLAALRFTAALDDSAFPKSPSEFDGFFEEIAALSPQGQQDIQRVPEIPSKYGLEILLPPGA